MASRRDPLFSLEAEWEPLGMSLREAAEGLMKWRGIPGQESQQACSWASDTRIG